MSEITKLLEQVRNTSGCTVLPPSGLPDAFGENLCPEDLREFYGQSGGVTLFEDRDFCFRLAHKELFVRANPLILGSNFKEFGPEMDATTSRHWYIVASGTGPEENLSIDLGKARLGKCYDSFYEVHGTPDCPIIALSFTDLFRNLFDSEGRTLFWQESDFEEIGFAEL